MMNKKAIKIIAIVLAALMALSVLSVLISTLAASEDAAGAAVSDRALFTVIAASLVFIGGLVALPQWIARRKEK